MKNTILLSVLVLLTIINNAQIVNIPDTSFKAALLAHAPVINTNGDNEIQTSEAEAFTDTIDVSSKSISDLTGIAAFVAISGLDCERNQLTSLDVSINNALTFLDCGINQLTSLDVSNNTALTTLYCGSNPLMTLDVSNNTLLTALWCGGNQLTSLDISNNTALTYLSCSGNQLTSLDISNNVALDDLNCNYNQLTDLDLSNNTNLTYLECNNNQLTSLDVSNNTSITLLWCKSNQLTFLDLSNNIALTNLACRWNQLTSLDVSNNTALISLYCIDNQLTSLDISNIIVLQALNCGYNQLTSLNVKNGINTNFYNFYALNNPDLLCIEVDDPAWSEVNWTNIDPIASFSTDCLSIVSKVNKTPKLSIYPNPFSAQINLNFEKHSTYEMIILDLLGKEMLSTTVTGIRNSISTSSLPCGTYILQVKSSDGIGIKKIVKQ